jgi:cell wall-associated NlpC family hydrolase
MRRWCRAAARRAGPARRRPPVASGQPLQPGDLVFFGADPADVTHVGIVVSPGEMVDAPHSGAVVRIEPYSWADYLGATRPAGTQP